MVESTPCKGLLFVLVGPSGAGKNGIMERVREKIPHLRQLPTITTRSMRPTEQNGREHIFVTEDQFREMITDHSLIEFQEVYPGKFYGTPRKPMQEALDAREKLIADIEVVGAGKLKQTFPDYVILIFIAPPTIQDLEKRLRNRGKMSEEEINERLARAPFEMKYADECDYRVVNDTFEHAVEQVAEIVRQELLRHGCD